MRFSSFDKESKMSSNTRVRSDTTASTESGTSTVTMVPPEKPQLKEWPTGGYTELARFMAQYPDLCILRRFETIGMESLFYLQARLAALETRLRTVQAESRNTENEACKFNDLSWQKFADSATLDPGDPRREQYDLIERITEAKQRYDNALFFHRQTSSLRRPHKKHLEDLRDWAHRHDRGNIEIIDCGCRTWDPKSELDDDLLTFEDSVMDGFTSFIVYDVIEVFHKYIWRLFHRKKNNKRRKQCEEEIGGEKDTSPFSNADLCPTKTYSNKAIVTFTRTVTVLMACMLPIGAILILYWVQDMQKRLGVIACLTGLFSVSMNLLTMATLSDIFQATAAFAAVLVVFIGTTNNANC